MLPLEVNKIKGYWLDNSTFDYTGFKLSVAIGCEYQLINERNLRDNISKEKEQERLAKLKAQQDYRDLNNSSKEKEEGYKQQIANLNVQITKQNEKHLKGTLRIVALGVAGIFTTWILNK